MKVKDLRVWSATLRYTLGYTVACTFVETKPLKPCHATNATLFAKKRTSTNKTGPVHRQNSTLFDTFDTIKKNTAIVAQAVCLPQADLAYWNATVTVLETAPDTETVKLTVPLPARLDGNATFT